MKIDKLIVTKPFKRDYQNLPENIKDRLDKQLKKLEQDPFYPSLKTGKLKHTQKIFYSRINKNYRFTWQFKNKYSLILRRCGTHDEILG